MSTQIQTTAGEIVKAYDLKIPEVSILMDEGAERFKAARAEWDAKSWWYRVFHSEGAPWPWSFYDRYAVKRLEESRTFYVGLDPEIVVLLDEYQAQYLLKKGDTDCEVIQ